ncbi:MAG: hypothetical protein R3B70_32500 [Polyangiaceae bacterium]
MPHLRALQPVLLVSAITLASGAIAAACGGSSSESPWPVEPDSPVLGPAGEEGKSPTSTDIPDAGTDAPPDVEP